MISWVFDDLSKTDYSSFSWNKGIINKGYDIIIYVYDVSNKFLSLGSNYIVDVVMWPKLGNSRMSIGEAIITSIL